MYSLPHLGLSLASCGRYDEALFDEAQRFGREYRIHNLLARSIAMSTGSRLDLGDSAARRSSHVKRVSSRCPRAGHRPPPAPASTFVQLR
jgi:hypothetical protein